MGHKTRGNYKIGLCLKDCANKGKECKTCIKFSNYKKCSPRPETEDLIRCLEN